MLKYTIYTLLYLGILICPNLIIKNVFSQKIDTSSQIVRIKAYYLSWNLKPAKTITEDDIRVYYKNRCAIYETSNIDTIQNICCALSIFNCDTISSDSYDLRMILDFYYLNGKISTICVTKSYIILYKNILYINYLFMKKIFEYLPKTTAPY
jgi:hypothetical protein